MRTGLASCVCCGPSSALVLSSGLPVFSGLISSDLIFPWPPFFSPSIGTFSNVFHSAFSSILSGLLVAFFDTAALLVMFAGAILCSDSFADGRVLEGSSPAAWAAEVLSAFRMFSREIVLLVSGPNPAHCVLAEDVVDQLAVDKDGFDQLPVEKKDVDQAVDA